MNKRLIFTENVIAVIRAIPQGAVTTYGRIAEYAGNRNAARQVAKILHSCSEKESLPWHRVVNREGRIVIAHDLAAIQKLLLEDEGVKVTKGERVCLDTYLWKRESR